jgi:hypothetical protein
VSALREHFEIVQAVVCPISVPMVYYLPRKERAGKVRFHDQAMLKMVLAAVGYKDVSIGANEFTTLPPWIHRPKPCVASL